MTIQYPSRSLAKEAARLAVQQHIAAQHAADQSSRLESPLEAAPHIPTLLEPSPAPGCVDPEGPVEDSPLRHLLIGSPAGVRHAIARLHQLDYVERHYWTPLIQITPRGVHITPAQGQVLSYLVRQRPIR
ncbi:MAG: hypothetical protein ACFB4J_11330 [Elainellaceae cyanobacterium]